MVSGRELERCLPGLERTMFTGRPATHPFRRRTAQPLGPVGKAGPEQLGVEGGHHLAQGVVRRHAARTGQEAPQEGQVLPTLQGSSTKSSVPAMVPHSSTGSTSGKRHSTVAALRRSRNAANFDRNDS